MPATKRPGKAGTAQKGPAKAAVPDTEPKVKKKPGRKPGPPRIPKPEGRPPLYTDPAVLQKRVDEYFATIGPEYMKDAEGNPMMTAYGKPCILRVVHPTIISLAHYLGMNRDTYLEYRKNPTFSGILKRADEVIQSYMVGRLMDPDVKPPGIQFILKNLHGWKDEQELKHTGAVGAIHSGEVAVKEIKITLVRPPETPTPIDPDDSPAA